MMMPFGKHKGTDTKLINSEYLLWLSGQEFMEEERNAELLTTIQEELKERDRANAHFSDDKADSSANKRPIDLAIEELKRAMYSVNQAIETLKKEGGK